MELGGLFSGMEIQTRTAEMTVWRDGHYSIATPATSINKILKSTISLKLLIGSQGGQVV